MCVYVYVDSDQMKSACNKLKDLSEYTHYSNEVDECESYSRTACAGGVLIGFVSSASLSERTAVCVVGLSRLAGGC